MKVYRTDQDGGRRLVGQYANHIRGINEACLAAEREAATLPNNPKVVCGVTNVEVRITYLVASYDLVFEGTDEGKTWKHFVDLMRSGVLVEIDLAMYERWLGVLPPATMGKIHKIGGVPQTTHFGFCEGDDWIIGFWNVPTVGDLQTTGWWEGDKNRYYCQKTEDRNPRPFG